MKNWIDADRRAYGHKQKYIDQALRGDTGIVDGVTGKNRENIFYMLLFCLCVPQSKAIKAEDAITLLREKKFYTCPLSEQEVLDALTSRVRFQKIKTKRLLEARENFDDLFKSLSKFYGPYCELDDKFPTLCTSRLFLIKTVNGMGMKLSSHFLRNIGMPGLSILDVHVLDGMEKRGIISDDIDLKKEYMQIEQKFFEYAKEVGISSEELDLFLWSEKTGYVFK